MCQHLFIRTLHFAEPLLPVFVPVCAVVFIVVGSAVDGIVVDATLKNNNNHNNNNNYNNYDDNDNKNNNRKEQEPIRLQNLNR